jgi:hypothetical protein
MRAASILLAIVAAILLAHCATDQGHYGVAPLVEKPPMATPEDKSSVFDTSGQSSILGLKLKRSW